MTFLFANMGKILSLLITIWIEANDYKQNRADEPFPLECFDNIFYWALFEKMGSLP